MSSTAEDAATIDEITGLVDQINAKTAEMHGNVVRLSGQLPEGTRQQTLAAWDSFVAELNGLWEALRDAVTYWGAPWKLWDTADAWSSQIGGPVGGLAGTASAARMQAENGTWQGTAATAYAQRLELMPPALGGINNTFADGVSGALSELARGIIAYWTTLALALAALLGGILGALVATGTIVGLPAAPVTAGVAVATAVAAVAAGALILTGDAASANNTLVRLINNNSDYPDGHWPPVTDTVLD
ncbi:hypothetical protein ABGB07_27955 [Micromonosporaceae bacterium B7E4]